MSAAMTLNHSLFRPWRDSRWQRLGDAELCAACLAGNEEAWGALVARYQNLIYSIPLKFRFTEDEAAEIFQAVALDLYLGIEKLRKYEKLQSWLISVTRHRCLRYKDKRQRGPLSAEESAEIAETLPDTRKEAEDWMLELVEESMLREALSQLPPRSQQMIEWLFYTDPPPSYAEIARRLDVAANSVGFLRDRALRKLRTVLSGTSFGREVKKPSKAATSAAGRSAPLLRCS